MITKQEQQDKRAEYMTGTLSHQDYYLWLADSIGIADNLIPFLNEQVKASKDQHLNDLPLSRWDMMHDAVRSYAKGLPWSLSDTVCCLKAMAKRRAAN